MNRVEKNFLVVVDDVSTYIPVVSTITNIVALFIKCVVLPFLSQSTIQTNHFYTHLQEKSFARCLILLVPIIGNLIIGILDCQNKSEDSSALLQLPPNSSPPELPLHEAIETPSSQSGTSGQISSVSRVEEDVPILTCPITLEPLSDPCILLEDGFTYDGAAITQWLATTPNRSPMIGAISSGTVRCNYTVRKGESVCPITKEAFEEPYFCVEDGHTYEKSAILQWFESKLLEKLEHETALPDSMIIRSPASGISLSSLTLYPNKVLFKKGIPLKQKPIVFRLNMDNILANRLANENQKIECIFDLEIRELIKNYSGNKSKRHDILAEIHKRRLHLGLDVVENDWHTPDLSHLDLSKMNLEGLSVKGSLLKETDMSDSQLNDCCLGSCRFVRCNMQRATLINCAFPGEAVSFFKTDMTDVVIRGRCSIEKGASWREAKSWKEILTEFSNRGALNVQSITYQV